MDRRKLALMKMTSSWIKYARPIVVLFYVSLISVFCINAECRADFKVLFKENRLYMDGKPFFFFGVWGVVYNLQSMKEHHVNTVFSGMWTSTKIIHEANKLGVMIIPYPYGPSWDKQMERLVREIEPKSAILAWNIGDDLERRHLEKVKEVYGIIRKIDPNPHRPIMLDSYSNCSKEKGESRMG